MKEIAEIVEDGQSFMEQALSTEDFADIERKSQLYDQVAESFGWQVGKEESRRERDEKGLKETSLTYGEIEFKSLY